MKAQFNNITLNAAFVHNLSIYDFIGFAFDCYITDKREYDYALCREFFEKSVLYDQRGNKRYTFVLDIELSRIYSAVVSDKMRQMWEQLMTHFALSVSTWTLDDAMDRDGFETYRGYIIEHVLHLIDDGFDSDWGLICWEECECENNEINNN